MGISTCTGTSTHTYLQRHTPTRIDSQPTASGEATKTQINKHAHQHQHQHSRYRSFSHSLTRAHINSTCTDTMTEQTTVSTHTRKANPHTGSHTSIRTSLRSSIPEAFWRLSTTTKININTHIHWYWCRAHSTSTQGRRGPGEIYENMRECVLKNYPETPLEVTQTNNKYFAFWKTRIFWIDTTTVDTTTVRVNSPKGVFTIHKKGLSEIRRMAVQSKCRAA